jgi:hypothetical protein
MCTEPIFRRYRTGFAELTTISMGAYNSPYAPMSALTSLTMQALSKFNMLGTGIPSVGSVQANSTVSTRATPARSILAILDYSVMTTSVRKRNDLTSELRMYFNDQECHLTGPPVPQ